MTVKFADRVFETSTTQGTGTINLAGPASGFRSFVEGVGDAAKTPYVMDDGVDWEIGLGTVTDGTPDTLSRDMVFASSNSNALVNWGPGTRNVRLAPVTALLLQRDANLNMVERYVAGAGSATVQTATFTPAPLALSTGMLILYKPPAANTGALTINFNGLGAKSVKLQDGSNPHANAMLTTGLYLLAYDGTNFVLLNPNIAPLLALKADASALSSYQPVNPRVQSVASAASVTPTNENDLVAITAQAEALILANPSGAMVQGQALIVRIKDNGTARAISYGSNYRAMGVALPTTTVINKTLYLAMIWNATDTKFDVTGVAQEA